MTSPPMKWRVSKSSLVQHLVNADGLKSLVHSQCAYYFIHKLADY